MEKKKNLIDRLENYKNRQYAFIIRTNALQADEETIVSEIDALVEKYNTIMENAKYRTCYSLMYEKEKSYRGYLRDVYKEGDRVITDMR